MPHEYKDGETVDGTQEGPIVHGLSSGACGTVYALSINEDGRLPGASDLVTEPYDELVLSYDGNNVTNVVYIYSSITQATITLSYDGNNVTHVVKTP